MPCHTTAVRYSAWWTRQRSMESFSKNRSCSSNCCWRMIHIVADAARVVTVKAVHMKIELENVDPAVQMLSSSRAFSCGRINLVSFTFWVSYRKSGNIDGLGCCCSIPLTAVCQPTWVSYWGGTILKSASHVIPHCLRYSRQQQHLLHYVMTGALVHLMRRAKAAVALFN